MNEKRTLEKRTFNKRSLYIVLTDTGTWLSRSIALYTGDKLNHVSLAFDAQLAETYSFGRKNPRNPFIGGFVRENLNDAWFRRRRSGREVECAVYRCEATEEAYRNIRRFVAAILNRKHRYKYNLLGLFCVAADIRLERKRAYFCSQFVATALAAGGIRLTDKPPCLTAPQDFKRSGRLELVYRGPLSAYFGIRSPKRSHFCYNHNAGLCEKSG